MIELREVTHRFGERTVLRALSLTLREPRIAVLGANGSGKSTFARLLNGLVVPSQGAVLVEGLDTRAAGAAVRRRVGFVFQNPEAQIVYPTVEEDIAFGLKSLKLSKGETAERVAAALARHGLSHLRQAPAHLLSGGEKQLLALAGVLAMEPRILVLDEPTTLLDLRNTRRVEQTLAALPQQVILVTHDLALAAGFGRVLVIDDGIVAFDGPPERAIPFYRERMAC